MHGAVTGHHHTGTHVAQRAAEEDEQVESGQQHHGRPGDVPVSQVVPEQLLPALPPPRDVARCPSSLGVQGTQASVSRGPGDVTNVRDIIADDVVSAGQPGGKGRQRWRL